MNRAERKRHEEAGWQVGSATDFLQLTPEEVVYIQLRMKLADAVKTRRQAARLSQKAFAMSMKSSQSRIAKAEANDSTVSLDLLVRSLIALGVTLGEFENILGVNQTALQLEPTSQRVKPRRKALKQSGKTSRTSKKASSNAA